MSETGPRKGYSSTAELYPFSPVTNDAPAGSCSHRAVCVELESSLIEETSDSGGPLPRLPPWSLVLPRHGPFSPAQLIRTKDLAA